MPFSDAVTDAEVRDVARKAIDGFSSYGLSCCLVGGVACSLYGMTRTPNDVDLVVLTRQYTTDSEQLKELLVNCRADFYTRAGRDGPYHVLWCRLPAASDYRNPTERSCKVDVLTPGIMNIPSVSHDKVIHIDGLPVMPFIAVLLLKVQSWTEHRASLQPHFQSKQYVDVRDIKQMLSIASRRGEYLSSSMWLPADFLRAGQERILRFIEYSRGDGEDLSAQWENIGFSIS